MKDYNNISKHLNSLPNRRAPEHIWCSIANKLDDNNVQTYSKLPLHQAPANLWNSIEANLTPMVPFYKKYWFAIAASLILLMGLSVLINMQQHEPKILVAEELINSSPNTETNYDLKTNVSQYCSQFPNICSTEKFTDLKKQLDNLKTQKEQLKSMQNFDTDPEINVYIERINMELISIERRLIAMF